MANDSATAPPAGSEPGPAPHEARPASGLRALVVEDEAELAGLVGSYLERDGFEVTLAYDGLRAVELAREVDPDVLVLDLGLPGLDGVEVCRRVRTFSSCYIVMLPVRTVGSTCSSACRWAPTTT